MEDLLKMIFWVVLVNMVVAFVFLATWFTVAGVFELLILLGVI